MQQAFPFQGFLFAVDPAQRVHQQSCAQQVNPSDVGRVESVHDSDEQVRPADDAQHIADLVQVVDLGIDVGEQVERAVLRFFCGNRSTSPSGRHIPHRFPP